jgi:NAD-dependent dihydropyrimidine dehydrogenase PreA subunit
MVIVDSKRCTGCGACVELCPVGAIRLIEEASGNHAEIDQAKCQQCEVCIEACPEQAIRPESEPAIEGEIVQAEHKPMPARLQPHQVHPARWMPKAMVWLGPALAFVGREVVPRLADALLDAWDRRSDRTAPYQNEPQAQRPVEQPMANSPRGQGRRHRRRGRG